MYCREATRIRRIRRWWASLLSGAAASLFVLFIATAVTSGGNLDPREVGGGWLFLVFVAGGVTAVWMFRYETGTAHELDGN
jgi:hypothetical protein